MATTDVAVVLTTTAGVITEGVVTHAVHVTDDGVATVYGGVTVAGGFVRV